MRTTKQVCVEGCTGDDTGYHRKYCPKNAAPFSAASEALIAAANARLLIKLKAEVARLEGVGK